MSSENLHAPRERLQQKTIGVHQATISLIEELEAQDWYRQRADDTDDPALKEILLHHMREEVEHAAMLLEWLRRHDEDFAKQLAVYLFTQGDITAIEEEMEGKESAEESSEPPSSGPSSSERDFTIGPLK